MYTDEKELRNRLKNNLAILSNEDIDNTIECLTHFKKFLRYTHSSKIMCYIQSLSEKEIERFENFAKKISNKIKLDE